MKISFQRGYWRVGLFTYYGWGWDIKLWPLRWWLVWSRSGHPLWVYISNDATPPNSGRTRGFFIWRSA